MAVTWYLEGGAKAQITNAQIAAFVAANPDPLVVEQKIIAAIHAADPRTTPLNFILKRLVAPFEYSMRWGVVDPDWDEPVWGIS